MSDELYQPYWLASGVNSGAVHVLGCDCDACSAWLLRQAIVETREVERIKAEILADFARAERARDEQQSTI